MNHPEVEALPKDRDELERRWVQLLNQTLTDIKSPADANETADRLRADEKFNNLVGGWDKMPTAAQANAWNTIQARVAEAARATRPFCVRCGDCCRAGSPALFDQDRPALASGAIDRRHLMTLRRGEVAWSNVAGRTVVLDREQVKLKEAAGGRTCVFLSPGGDACLIYADRPHACRVMDCWDHSRFRKLLDRPPLTRAALLGQNPLTEVMAEHDRRCSPADLGGLLAEADPEPTDGPAPAVDMILFDLHVREFTGQKFNLDPEEMDFLFGRPLARLCGQFGWDFEIDPDGQPRLTRRS